MSGHIEGFEAPLGAYDGPAPRREKTTEEHYRDARASYERAKAENASPAGLAYLRRELLATFCAYRTRVHRDETALRRWRWWWAIQERRRVARQHVDHIAWTFNAHRDATTRLARGHTEKGKPYAQATLNGLRSSERSHRKGNEEAIERFRQFLGQPCPGYHEWRRQQYPAPEQPASRPANVVSLMERRAQIATSRSGRR